MNRWPAIPYADFRETHKLLHMGAQIVGKFRLAQTPWLNHSWQATFYVTPRGLTTSIIPGPEKSYEALIDFQRHRVIVISSAGEEAGFPLEAMSVADFWERFHAALTDLGAPADLHDAPNEVPDPEPFAEQTERIAYNIHAAENFHQALIAMHHVFEKFRSGFIGKASPPHFFWGSFDFAATRFSGRLAPLHPGGFPALPDEVTREAYSHEVSSAGFWPGGPDPSQEASFYSYAYPTPEGFKAQRVAPADAVWSEDLGEFILPYEAVRGADQPEAALIAFLQSTYEAAATLGQWDREALECPYGEAREPRPLSRGP